MRNFSYTLVDDKIYYRENIRMYPVEEAATAKNRIRGMIALRDCVRQLIEYQMADYPDEAISAQQRRLNRLYDSFTEKYGLINSRGNSMAFSEDSSYSLLCSLEIIDEDGNLECKLTAVLLVVAAYSTRTSLHSLDFARLGYSDEQLIHHMFLVGGRARAVQVASWRVLPHDRYP